MTWRLAGRTTVALGVVCVGVVVVIVASDLGLRIVAFVSAAWHSLGCALQRDWLCETMAIVCRSYRGLRTLRFVTASFRALSIVTNQESTFRIPKAINYITRNAENKDNQTKQ